MAPEFVLIDSSQGIGKIGSILAGFRFGSDAQKQ
jgi:hypothetical protein